MCVILVPLECLFNTTILNLGNEKFELIKSIPLLVALIILLMLSAFFSSCETALSTSNIIRLKGYAEEKKKGARKALYLAEKFDVTLITLLVGNNLVNIGATTISAYILGQLLVNPTLYNLVNTFGMTIIVLIFGEILPKSYAKENPETYSLKIAGILFFIQKLLWPFSFVFYKMRSLMIRKSNKKTPQVTEEELESIIEAMEDDGVIENDNAELMQNALDINDTTVYEIMTPRVDVVAVSIDEDVESIKKVFFEYKYSRIPVYDRDKDNMIGILRERDFLTAYISQKENLSIRKIMSSPYFVSKETKVDDLIKEMQEVKKHFAIVLDEYGGTSGIVTMEDALEELVGEIYDEYDDAPELDFELQKINDNKYQINPEMSIEDLFDELDLGKKPESSYHNVGGLVYELCEEPPFKGKKVTYNTFYENTDIENPITIEYKLTFTIDRVVKRRIKSLTLNVEEVNEVEEN